MSAQERIDLITRTAQWCHDQTETWHQNNTGAGLAYLFWGIADGRGPVDVTGGEYDEMVSLLKANPNGLWDALVEGGFICP